MKKRIIIGVIAVLILITGGIGAKLYLDYNNADKQQEKGRAFFKEDAYEKSVKAYERAIELDDEDPDSYIGLSEVYLEMEDLDSAEAILLDGLDEDDEERDFYLLLSDLYYEKDDYKSALEIIEEGIKLTESSKVIRARDDLVEKITPNALEVDMSKTYKEGDVLRLDPEKNETIYYTIDGLYPDEEANEYDGSIELNHDMVLMMVASNDAGIKGPVTEYYIDVIEKPTLPVANVESGSYEDGVWLELWESNGYDVYFTLDGSEPDDSSSLFTEMIWIEEDTEVKAISYNGSDASSAVSFEYEIQPIINATITVQVEPSWWSYYYEARDRVLQIYPRADIRFVETGMFDHLDVLDATGSYNQDVADVFTFPYDRYHNLRAYSALAQVDGDSYNVISDGKYSTENGMMKALSEEGDHYAYPFSIETLMVFANEANAGAQNVNLNGAIELTDHIKNVTIPMFNAWFGIPAMNAADIALLEKDASGNLYSDMTRDYGTLSQDEKKVFEGIYDYWKFYNDYNDDMFDTSNAWGFMENQFTEGKPGVIRLEGPWASSYIGNGMSDPDNLRILPINQLEINGIPIKHWRFGSMLGFNARIEGDKEKQILAEAMVMELINPEYAVDFFQVTGRILESADPARYQVNGIDSRDSEMIAALAASYELAAYRPVFVEWGKVWQAWESGVLSWNSIQPGSAEEAYGLIQNAFIEMMNDL